MALPSAGDFGLFKDVLPQFRDAVIPHIGARSRNSFARELVNADSRVPAEAFHATVYGYLESLQDKSKAWSDGAFLENNEAQAAVQDLLLTLEALVHELHPDGTGKYPSLEFVRHNPVPPSYLQCPPSEFREKLRGHLKLCVKTLGADGVSSSIRAAAQSEVEWEPARAFFSRLRDHERNLGKRLRTDCACNDGHDSVFSFATPCANLLGRKSYCMKFRRGEKWESALIYIDEDVNVPNSRSQSEVNDKRKTPSTTNESVEGDSTSLLSFCQIFNQQLQDHARLGPRISFERRRPSRDGEMSGQQVERMFSLRGQMPLETSGFLDSEEDRVTFLLFVSYAFMNLHGSDWWPTHWVQPDFWFANCASGGTFTVIQPFLIYHLIGPIVSSWSMERFINKSNISIPAFGKLILEVWTRRSLDWQPLGAVEAQCRKSLCGGVVFDVASSFLDSQKAFQSDSRLPDNSEMRREFFNSVVKVFQYLLRTFCSKTMNDIFQKPSTGDIHTEEETMLEDSSDDDPGNLRTIDDTNGNEFLLTEDSSSVKPSEAWLAKLKNSVRSLLTANFFSGAHAVKIAILDTGANFTENELHGLFEGGVKAYYDWCTSSTSTEGKAIPLDDLDEAKDPEDHGTYLASLILRVAPDCELYIAKVFQSRSDMQGARPDDTMAKRVANAISHAVDIWGVDIVSMSFGFKDPVPVIHDVIETATSAIASKPTIFIAAASNEGGNDGIYWPASHERVICMHATHSNGDKYAGNPTPTNSRTEFATIGCDVKPYLGSDGNKDRSGTSVATAVAAGIAALVLDIVRRGKSAYLDASSGNLDEVEERFEENLKRVSSYAGMSGVFDLMAEQRDGYRYVRPWEVLKKDTHTQETFLIDHIFNASRKYRT